MRLTLIRLILIALLYLLLTYIIHWESALLASFVIEYILEPLITSKI